MRFERWHEPLLPRAAYLSRLMRSALVAGGLVMASLMIGMLGYHWLARLAWLDAFLNASMILTGMGPVDRMDAPAAKLFAASYALFSGVAFISSVGVLLAPVFHRFIHRFHLAEDSDLEPRRRRR